MSRKSELSAIALRVLSNGDKKNREDPITASLNASRQSARQLEERFERISKLMYTTSVPLSTLEEEIIPYLAPSVSFIDPWVSVHGLGKYRTGLRGFHCITRFDLDVFQVNVKLNDARDGGRAIVDGVMNLRQLGFYTYPLRTILTYEFVMIDGGRSLKITKHEEIWSLGDMIQNVPLAGRLYDGFRAASGHVITALFWLGCAITGKARGSRPSP